MALFVTGATSYFGDLVEDLYRPSGGKSGGPSDFTLIKALLITVIIVIGVGVIISLIFMCVLLVASKRNFEKTKILAST